MKLGFVSSILEESSFEEVIDTASKLGFECVELACWPQEEAERRYAGVSHLNLDELDKNKINYVREYCKKKNVQISSLAYYPNTLDTDMEKRKKHITHLKKLIRASNELGVNLITTFIGKDQTKTVEENLEIVKTVWPEILLFAQERNVKVAIENCPMLFGPEQWPGGQNLMTTPSIWNEIFELLPYENLGINYDPSHFVWQMIDYIKPIYMFKERIFHVHFKDIKIYKDKLNEVGVMAYPLEFMSPKIPGLGDVDWGKYVSALTDIGYNGYTCIEIEDKAFEKSQARIIESLKLSKRYMEQFVV